MKTELQHNTTVSIYFEGAVITGAPCDPFRVYVAFPDFNEVLGPFWAHKRIGKICERAVPGWMDTIRVKFALEPHGCVYANGVFKDTEGINLTWSQSHLGDVFMSQPIALRFMDGPPSSTPLSRMILVLKWELHEMES